MKMTHFPHMMRSNDRGHEPGSSASWAGLLMLGAVLCLGGAAKAVEVDFEQDVYAAGVGQALEMRVMIDYELHTPQSLFSYGLRMTSSPQAHVTVTGIEVPPALDHNFTTGTADTDLSPGVWSVKGHVALAAPPRYYMGSLLATYTVQFSRPGTYRLALFLNQTAGSNEEVFVDGDANVLDNALTPMGTAQVVVGEVEAPVLTLTHVVFPAGAVDVKFQTQDSVSYLVQTSTDLVKWSDLGTITGDGTVRSYRHLGGGRDPRRFYQVTATLVAP
jgi:hypothetical protein